MLLNEIAEEVGMTKRAIKYYEEKNLLSVKKEDNGYRNYTEEDAAILKKISVYRKLGIGIKDIEELLKGRNEALLASIYREKEAKQALLESQLEALRQFIDHGDAAKADELLDYQSINSAIESLIPGEWSNYFKHHFRPFLDVQLKTEEQKQAFHNLLRYCDETTIKVPILMRLGFRLAAGLHQKQKTAEELIASYRNLDEAAYQQLKRQVLRGAKLKSGIMKYHPVYIAQRKFQRELQNKGYNDIFLPNLKALSPTYKDYANALEAVNDRICRELGLHYDSHFNLVLSKQKPD